MRQWSQRSVVVLALVVAVAGWLIGQRGQTVRGAGDATQPAGHDYTVVSSDGANLVVTDNHAHTVFFYSLDDDDEFGGHLKLRGKIDLAQVGKPELVPEMPPPPKKQPR
jgi:hypothetical protein